MASDEAQYLALMNAGVTFAQQYGLRPGVASGDIDGSGSLLSGNSVNMQLIGDVTNGGTIAGREVVKIDAANIQNLGGRVSGGQVQLKAREDINNIGGTIDAARRFVLAVELLVDRQALSGSQLLLELMQSLLDSSNLSPSWIHSRGWHASHAPMTEFVGCEVRRLVNHCRREGIEKLYAFDTLDLQRQIFEVRRFACSGRGMSQALCGIGNSVESDDKMRDWLNHKVQLNTLVFSMETPLPFLLLQNRGSWVTLVGPGALVAWVTHGLEDRWSDGLVDPSKAPPLFG